MRKKVSDWCELVGWLDLLRARLIGTGQIGGVEMVESQDIDAVQLHTITLRGQTKSETHHWNVWSVKARVRGKGGNCFVALRAISDASAV